MGMREHAQAGCPRGDANHGRSIPSSLRELPDEIRSLQMVKQIMNMRPLFIAARPCPAKQGRPLQCTVDTAIDMVGARSPYSRAGGCCFWRSIGISEDSCEKVIRT